MTLIVQVSDTHFDNSPATAQRNARVWDYLEALPFDPELVLHTGDVTDHGLSNEYREAARRVAGRHRVAAIPGNHDRRTDFAEGLPGVTADSDPAGPLDLAVELAELTVIALDSTVPSADGERIDHGHLAESSLIWLDRQLAARPAGRTALVALHHPPVALGHPTMDAIRLDNPDDLADVLNAHRDIAGIVCGHAHTATAATFAGLPVRIAPGVASTITLEGEPGELLNRDLPPGFAFHEVRPDGTLITQFRHL
ncbi:3',5'-cyclic AMP phosphodiesterase CpdA [Naumannella cuiyingiana]|uniref:3',5'-cyclic AMP phosphodiesterase CpdA n=1 Tax=Naumannella cuiyingiana TaxID=1347891 RepID=A0A7Z0DC43_9ACTN|nr:3',5'-cyclic AMP phosphodiesterase CpdA [Naumannella cuiyingiana]